MSIESYTTPRISWQPQIAEHAKAPRYNSDELINAYLAGRKEGSQFYAQAIIQRFEQNFELATSTAEKFVASMKATGIESVDLRLRVDAPDRFTALFAVADQHYFSDQFDEIYSRSITIKNKVNTDNFNLAMIFSNQADLLDRLLIIDGFSLRYAPGT